MTNPVDIYLNSLSITSRNTAKNVLASFQKWLSSQYSGQKWAESSKSTGFSTPDIWWSKITYNVLIAYIEHLKQSPKLKKHQTRKQKAANTGQVGREAATIKLYVTIIKGCMGKACVYKPPKLKHRVTEQQLREIEHIKLNYIPAKKHLVSIGKRHFRVLVEPIKECSDVRNVRNKSIFTVMYYAGLRASEVTKLRYPGSINFHNSCLVIDGKGSKERIVPLHKQSKMALRKWLRYRSYEPGPLFFTIPKNAAIIKNIPSKPITTHGISFILSQLCTLKNLPPYQTHDFRRTFATSLFECDVDTPTIRELMGHASTDSTVIYDMRDEKRKYKAISLL